MSLLTVIETCLRYAEAGVKLTSQFVAELQGKKIVKQEAEKSNELEKPVSHELSAESFADKVDWEGGIFEALRYGLRASDLKDQNSELAKQWAELESRWNDLLPLVNNVQMLLDEAWGSD